MFYAAAHKVTAIAESRAQIPEILEVENAGHSDGLAMESKNPISWSKKEMSRMMLKGLIYTRG